MLRPVLTTFCVALAGALVSLLALYAGAATAQPASAAEPWDQLYGLRLGVPLAGQLVQCPGNAGDTRGSATPHQPCWETPQPLAEGVIWQGVRLPTALYAETGLLQVRGIRVEGNRVVEVELEGMAADLDRLARSLRQRKGPPTESETLERHGRVFGVSRTKFHTWQNEQVTIYFDEQSQSGQPRVRAFLNAWASKGRINH